MDVIALGSGEPSKTIQVSDYGVVYLTSSLIKVFVVHSSRMRSPLARKILTIRELVGGLKVNKNKIS